MFALHMDNTVWYTNYIFVYENLYKNKMKNKERNEGVKLKYIQHSSLGSRNNFIKTDNDK